MATDLQRLKELFVAAIELPDPQAREAFLKRECGGDANLLQRLQALLAAHDQPQPALDRPLGAIAAADVQAQAQAPSQAQDAQTAGRVGTEADAAAGTVGAV